MCLPLHFILENFRMDLLLFSLSFRQWIGHEHEIYSSMSKLKHEVSEWLRERSRLEKVRESDKMSENSYLLFLTWRCFRFILELQAAHNNSKSRKLPYFSWCIFQGDMNARILHYLLYFSLDFWIKQVLTLYKRTLNFNLYFENM